MNYTYIYIFCEQNFHIKSINESRINMYTIFGSMLLLVGCIAAIGVGQNEHENLQDIEGKWI